MPSYRYQAFDVRFGRYITDTIEAPSREMAEKCVTWMGYWLLEIEGSKKKESDVSL